MLNRPATEAGPDAGLNTRLRTMRILWAVFLVCVGQFALVGWFARAEADASAEGGTGVPPLLYVFAAVGVASVAASFVLKSNFYRRAAERQDPAQLQTGFILAMVFCEVAALLGLVGLFQTPGVHAYALFALAALGEALHFPRREQVMSAYYK
jgi:hypothetical protein